MHLQNRRKFCWIKCVTKKKLGEDLKNLKTERIILQKPINEANVMNHFLPSRNNCLNEKAKHKFDWYHFKSFLWLEPLCYFGSYSTTVILQELKKMIKLIDEFEKTLHGFTVLRSSNIQPFPYLLLIIISA